MKSMRETMVGLKQKEINSLGKWYQTIDFGKYGKSKGSAKHLDKKWELIKEELPFSLKDRSVLDLGCNAGYFTIQAAREGAEKITGAEENITFCRQFLFTMRIFSSLEDITRKSTIGLIEKNALDRDFSIWQDTYDVTFAFNFFYWLTYSDEHGSIEKPEETFLRFLRKLSFHTKYLLVIGAEGVAKDRERKGLNSLGTSLKKTLPFLQPYFDICSAKIFVEGKKESNIILCRAKEH